MKSKYALWEVDQKGRIQIPLAVREKVAMYGQVAVEIRGDTIVLKSLPKIDDPIQFLSSFNIKTKKTPVEMKREAEEGFMP